MGGERRAVPEQRIEDAGHTAGEGHDGNVLASARGDAEGPRVEGLCLRRPAPWGKLVRSSHGGWKEICELGFGGGHKVFRHVIWATDEEDGADRDHGHRQWMAIAIHL